MQKMYICIVILVISTLGLVHAQSTHCYTDLIGNTDCTYTTPTPTYSPYIYIPTFTTKPPLTSPVYYDEQSSSQDNPLIIGIATGIMVIFIGLLFIYKGIKKL